MQEEISKLKNLIASFQRIAVLSGAGMSTESGIPDFRSSTGIYNTITSERIFDIDEFHRDPAQFYRFRKELQASILHAEPNAGHLALATLEKQGKQIEIATQNIDGLHQKAGSTRVYEVHGTMHTLTCTKCRRSFKSADVDGTEPTGEILRCPCGGVLKPDITFFGEMLPEKAISDAIRAMEKAELVIVLGTSLQVYPAASLPSYRPAGVPLVIINMTPTPYDSEATLVLHSKIGEVLGSVVG